ASGRPGWGGRGNARTGAGAGWATGWGEGEPGLDRGRGAGAAGPAARGVLARSAASAEPAAALAAGPAGGAAEAAAGGALARTTLGLLEADDVLRLEPPGLLDHVEFDPLTLVQGAEAGALDGGVVDEHVRTAVLLDEPVPLFLGEPFHGACGASHVLYP